MPDRETALKLWELERARLEQARPKFNHLPHAIATLLTIVWVVGWIGFYADHRRFEKAYDRQMQDFYTRYRAALQAGS